MRLWHTRWLTILTTRRCWPEQGGQFSQTPDKPVRIYFFNYKRASQSGPHQLFSLSHETSPLSPNHIDVYLVFFWFFFNIIYFKVCHLPTPWPYVTLSKRIPAVEMKTQYQPHDFQISNDWEWITTTFSLSSNSTISSPIFPPPKHSLGLCSTRASPALGFRFSLLFLSLNLSSKL